MYCVQCEQTLQSSKGIGCASARGQCGKTAEVSDLQDALIHLLQAVSVHAKTARALGVVDADADTFVPRALFATLTNVNFDADRIVEMAREAEACRERLKKAYSTACAQKGVTPEALPSAAQYVLPATTQDIATEAIRFVPNLDLSKVGADVIGLRLLCLYGLKGAAAYMEHARVLGQTDPAIAARFHDFMAFLADKPADMGDLFQCALDIGSLNYQIMAMLDKGQTETFGHPAPTRVNTHAVTGHAILVSGHDLHDLDLILQQTAGRGINVYTHGELLPAHAYPAFKKYPHLVGNYGTAWQNQQREFAAFPGAIVMTSNCLIDPEIGAYADRVFTRNVVGWPGVAHVTGGDFSAVIDKALSLPGFTSDETPLYTTTGFAHNALMQAAPTVIEQVKAGNIRHFFLIGGCDGVRPSRDYYAEFAQTAPRDSVILTLACGKFRFNTMEFGDINGVPRLLDIGQCNDAYSAIQLALALADAFGCGVNDLPLSLVLSWFEQKAIVILLTLLSLGVKDIRVGPTAPAFLTPALLGVLGEKFGLKLITTPEQDMREMLAA